MTQLLVSVRDAAEARGALAGGADIVDVKEPSRGALGRADAAVWAEIAAVCRAASPSPRTAMSVALGEATEHTGSAAVPVVPAGVRWAKLGLAGLADGPAAAGTVRTSDMMNGRTGGGTGSRPGSGSGR